MKKGNILLLATVFLLSVFILTPAARAIGTRIEVPEVGLSILIPENFYTAGRDGEISADVPPGFRDKLEELRNSEPESYLFAYSSNGLYRATMHVSGTRASDYTEMAGDEFVGEMELWGGAVWDTERLISIEPYRTGNALFIKSVIENQGEYSVEFRTAVGKQLYMLQFDTLGFSEAQRSLSEEDEAIACAMAESIVIMPIGQSSASASAPIPSAGYSEPAMPVPSAAMQEAAQSPGPAMPVRIDALSLTFELPDHFTCITREEDIAQVPDEWRELFSLMQPNMKETGVYYYAVRVGYRGKITQMAVTERNADINALQAFFDAGTNMLDSMTVRTDIYRKELDARMDTPVFVNDITFDKQQRFSGNYSWLFYRPQRNDLDFAFAYAGDGSVIAAVEATDMNAIVQSFHATTADGKSVPGPLSPTEYMKGRFYTVLAAVTAACVLAALLIVILRCRRDKSALREDRIDIEKNMAVIQRLRRLRTENILTSSEYTEKKKEILSRIQFWE